nr:351_t:CDS:1 [Entrophospora candida]
MKGGFLSALIDKMKNKTIGHVFYVCGLTLSLTTNVLLALEIAFWFDLNSYQSKLLWNVTALRLTILILGYQDSENSTAAEKSETSIRISEDVENMNVDVEQNKIFFDEKEG